MKKGVEIYAACGALLLLLFFSSVFHGGIIGYVLFSENIDESVIYFSDDSPSNESIASSIVLNVSYDVSENSYSFLNYNRSLLLWLRGENSASDDSGYGNDGVLLYDTTYGEGIFNQSFYFDGTLDIVNVSSDDINDLDEFTVSVWAKRTIDYPTDSRHFIFSKGVYNQPANSNWGLLTQGNGTYVRYYVGNTYVDDPNSPFTAQALPTDTWVHLAMTYNRSGLLKAYINGSFLDSIAVNSTAEENFNDLWIGSRGGSYGEWFGGNLDEFMIFGEVLSDDEITQLYNNSAQEIYRTYEGEFGQVTFQGLAVNESGYVYAGEELYVTITTDLALPVTAVSAPENNSYSGSSNVTFNWTTTSTAEVDSFVCNLTIDGVVNVSGIAVDKDVLESVTVEGFEDGEHTWNVTCNDSLENSNSTETYMFNIDTASFVNVTSPSESTWTSDYSLNLSAVVNYSLGSYALLDLNDSLVFWLTGENDFLDSSGNGHTVESSGGVLVTNGGVFGKKIDFNGTNYLKIDNSGADFDFDWDNDFSWAAWVYPHDTTQNDFFKIGSGSTDTPRLRNYEGTMMLYLENPTANAGGTYAASVGETYLDTWHQVVATWDASERNMSVYIDGSIRQSRANTTYPEFVNYDNLYLGIGLNGSMDEIMVFDVPVSAEVVEGLYNASVHTFEYLPTVSEGEVLPYVFYGVDKNGRHESSSGTVTIDVADSNPLVTLSSPGSLERTSDTTPNFVCSANSTNDDDTISSISLYWNQSGEFESAGSSSFSSAGGVATFTKSLSTGESVLWNCYACDSSGNCAFASANRTLVIGSNSYYVSKAGDDSGEGTLDDPFLTVQKCAETVLPGDTCYIREGTYNETVIPSNSGCGNAAITFMNYNSEEVTISGAQNVSNWELDTGSIYKTSDVTWDLGDGANQVFVDGQMMIEARWPNSYDLDVMRPNVSAYDATSETIDSNNGYINITDSDLPFSADEMDGMRVVIVYSPRYATHSGLINASGDGWFTFNQDDGVRSNVEDGNGEYYVYGNYSLLDAPGEWYYNSSSGELFLWAIGGGEPSGVTVKRRDVAFNLTNKSYIELNGLKITAGRILTDRYSHDLTFDSLNITYPDHYQRMEGADVGRYGSGTSGNLLYGYNHLVDEIWARFAPGNMFSLMGHDINITNSTMFDSDYMATITGVLSTGNGDSGTITRNIRIEDNTIYNSGRDVVRHDYSENFKLLGNTLYNTSVGLLTRDLGVVNSISTNHRGSEIAYNSIHDEGYNFTGIYFDGSYANNISIHDNLIYGARWGILGVKDHMAIYHNTIDVSGNSGNNIAGIYGTAQHSDFNGTVIKNNVLLGGSILYSYDVYNDLTLSELQAYDSVVYMTQANNSLDVTAADYFSDAASNVYTPLVDSSSVDAGTLISGFHCSESYDDNPLQYDCAYWTGSAPDLGAYEYPNTFLKNWIDTPTAISEDEDDGDTTAGTTNPAGSSSSGGSSIPVSPEDSNENNEATFDKSASVEQEDIVEEYPMGIQSKAQGRFVLSGLFFIVICLVFTLIYLIYLLVKQKRRQ